MTGKKVFIFNIIKYSCFFVIFLYKQPKHLLNNNSYNQNHDRTIKVNVQRLFTKRNKYIKKVSVKQFKMLIGNFKQVCATKQQQQQTSDVLNFSLKQWWGRN